jgi:hypothetical protein
MLSVQNRRSVDAFWARYLGCTVDELCPKHTLVLQHSRGLMDTTPYGIYIFVAGGAPIISLPPESFERLKPLAARLSTREVRDPVSSRFSCNEREAEKFIKSDALH